MPKTNAQRQADWRFRRKQELESLRNESEVKGLSISLLTQEEHDYLRSQLEQYRAGKTRRQPADRFDAIQTVMQAKIEIDKTKAVASRSTFRKTQPVSSWNRDLFDE